MDGDGSPPETTPLTATTTQTPPTNNSDMSSVSRRFNRQNTKPIERSLNDYVFMETLGSGSYSQCKKCYHKESDKYYAVKVSLDFNPKS